MMRAILAAAALLAAPGAAKAAAPLDPSDAASLEPKLGAPVPRDASFLDENGRAVTLGRYLDRAPVVLAPVYYRCPNICGLSLDGLFAAASTSGLAVGDEVEIVAFSIDPQEGPAVARAALDEHLARYPGLEGVHFLTGSGEASRTVADALGFRYSWDEALGQYMHAAAVAVVTPEGTISRYLRGLDVAARDLRLAVVESGRGLVGRASDVFWLFCMSYDPDTGRYTVAIVNIMRIAGSLTALAVALVLGRWWWRERRAAPTALELP